VVLGLYEELPSSSEHQGARQVAQRLFEKRAMWWEPAALAPNGERRPPIVFRIHIGSVSGRRTSHPEDGGTSQTDPVAEPARPGWATALWRRLRPTRRASPADRADVRHR